MRPRPRAAVASYLEVFVLIALAIGGSAVVFGAALGTATSARGGGVSLAGATIRQGDRIALESLAVYNVGDAPFAWFVVSTGGVPAAASYCYTLYDPAGRTVLSSTCPAVESDPASVNVSARLDPGRGVLVELTIVGPPLALGSVSTLTVTTSDGAQGSLDVEVVPA